MWDSGNGDDKKLWIHVERGKVHWADAVQAATGDLKGYGRQEKAQSGFFGADGIYVFTINSRTDPNWSIGINI